LESPGASSAWALILPARGSLLYGLKGAAAYADHAQVLGVEDPEVYGAFIEGLAFLAEGAFSEETLLARCLDAGALNLRVMELLDRANTSAYGHPGRHPCASRRSRARRSSSAATTCGICGAAQADRWHRDQHLHHGEMLPAHGYPELKKYAHLVGNLRRCLAGPSARV